MVTEWTGATEDFPMKHNDIGTTVQCGTPEAAHVKARQTRLMAARAEAVTRGDWATRDEITKRLIKLPVIVIARVGR